MSKDIRVKFIGRPDKRIPSSFQNLITQLEKKTEKNKKMTFLIALNYDGKSEIVDAFHKLRCLNYTKITEEIISSCMYNPKYSGC